MSVYRRRVMQVKHPPNQITAVYNVTSTTSATPLCASTTPIKSIIIDGENVGVVQSYTFSAPGNHEVCFIIDNNATSFMNFFNGITSLISADFSEFKNSIKNANKMFGGCSSLSKIEGASNLHKGDLQTASFMFHGCSSLNEIDVSSWDMGETTNLYYMFCGCGALTKLDTSKWILSKATNIGYLFYECKVLSELDTSKWDLGAVTSANYAFYQCWALSHIDTSAWNLGVVKDTRYMFSRCVTLNGIDVSTWGMGNLTDARYMFENCIALTKLDASNWDLKNVTKTSYMFAYCPKLAELRFNTELSSSYSKDSTTISGTGTDSPKLYYYPHASFVEKFLPIFPAKWTKIDITTLE